MARRPLNQEVLGEIIRRVVETAQPEKIVLFGSAARGELGPSSDVDLLVVKGGKFAAGIHPASGKTHAIRGAGAPPWNRSTHQGKGIRGSRQAGG
jgi:Nucleotidyltransferase domain